VIATDPAGAVVDDSPPAGGPPNVPDPNAVFGPSSDPFDGPAKSGVGDGFDATGGGAIAPPFVSGLSGVVFSALGSFDTGDCCALSFPGNA
jgi:hypothetical protein